MYMTDLEFVDGNALKGSIRSPTLTPRLIGAWTAAISTLSSSICSDSRVEALVGGVVGVELSGEVAEDADRHPTKLLA